ncbi:MAG: hypothetical protein ACT4R6_00815 [Gemmatimonadaceae bacterium]
MVAFDYSRDDPRIRVRIRYARPHGLFLRGPVTSAPYEFRPHEGALVDPQDADALLDTGLFERV